MPSKHAAKHSWLKTAAKIFLAIVLVLAGLALFFYYRFQPTPQPGWGLNFSPELAEYLGFAPEPLFRQMLDDFRPPSLRLTAYWETLEPTPGKFDFSSIDAMLRETDKRGTKVILVLGHKQPRWPECHHPTWYEKLSPAAQSGAVLTMLRSAVEHFKQFSSIQAWQIENEPFFPYGPNCPAVPAGLFVQELALVKSLDLRPLVATDSGEKGAWLPTVWAGADIFGSTMYRTVYQNKQGKYLTYPIPPALYRIRAGILETFSGVREVFNVELQAEPWFATSPFDTPWEKQAALMNPGLFAEYVDYARQVGFAENYFWGVEWWYWAFVQGHPEMWQTAKDFFQKNS